MEFDVGQSVSPLLRNSAVFQDNQHDPSNLMLLHLAEELEIRLDEAERVGYGFNLPEFVVAPNAPGNVEEPVIENAA
jgi:hypothetical protein